MHHPTSLLAGTAIALAACTAFADDRTPSCDGLPSQAHLKVHLEFGPNK